MSNFLDKAKELAAQAREKAGSVAEKAGDAAAKGVSVVADKADDVTGGKYTEKIESVSEKVEKVLDPDGSTKKDD
ncbi:MULTISPECIES: antitoxin [Actinoalloteichus]|uniref:Antitoxin protein n=1 Tax=Actinoalloteichus fjordicus TaxID=1612552 RepID=A0AAC9L8G5_9PSEU|nr:MULTISPECIES: antitoxin [Actinoalloteichus]APU12731.1 antitoxin protein [Actinoalloteichus fjordicus]APU18701.1 antitoxin protein [Actinoalloteichus sp. GBA129-24]